MKTLFPGTAFSHWTHESLTQRANHRCRAGLAPLELVLALPLLLCVMALIVNFAHASIWKVRTATAARLAMWRHRPMWNADGDSKPPNMLPQTATMGVTGASRIAQVDPIWNDPRIQQTWITGPVFSVHDGYLQVRNNRVNEMSEGVAQGNADVSVRYPFLPSMGKLNMSAENLLLDSVWQFHTMGYGWNEARRAKGWWNVEDSFHWNRAKQDFLNADLRMTSYNQRHRLLKLDRDPDLIAEGYPFDFYPRFQPMCTDSVREVQDALQAQGGLLDQIAGRNGTPGVTLRMARSLVAWYAKLLSRIEHNPPNAFFAALINKLKSWIEQLKKDIEKLQMQSQVGT